MTMNPLYVRRSIEIKASPERVWNVIVSPAAMARWMLVRPEPRAEPLRLGSKMVWTRNRKAYLTGTVVTLEPARRFVLELDDGSWPRPTEPGEVTYALTLSRVDGRTRLELSFGDVSIDPDSEAWYEAYDQGRELEAIKALSEAQAQE